MLVIRSSDRTSGNTTNCTFQLPNKLTKTQYQAASISLPISWYNVNNSNNVIATSLGNAQISNGQYTAGDLATATQTALQVVSATFSCTHDEHTGKYTIANTAEFTLNFAAGATNSARALLGFSATNTAFVTSATSDIIPDLAPIKNVAIHIDEAKTPVLFSGANTVDVSLIVPIREAFGSVLTLLSTDLKQSVEFKNRIRSFHVTLRSLETGQIIDANNADWTIILH